MNIANPAESRQYSVTSVEENVNEISMLPMKILPYSLGNSQYPTRETVESAEIDSTSFFAVITSGANSQLVHIHLVALKFTHKAGGKCEQIRPTRLT